MSERLSSVRRCVAAIAVVALAGCWDVEHLKNGVRDAGPTTGDGGPSGGGDAGAGCVVGAHLFCDDFESEALRIGGDGWDTLDLRAGGALDLVTAQAHSGQRSVRAAVPRNDSRTALFATLHKRLPIGTWRPLRIELGLFVPRPAWEATDRGTATFMIALLPRSGGGDPITWNFGMVSAEGSQIYAALPTPAIAKGTTPTPYGRWFRFAVEWDPLGTGAFVATIDGVPFDQRTLHPDSGVTATSPAALDLDVGVARFDGGGNVPTPPIEVYVDDVIVDVR